MVDNLDVGLHNGYQAYFNFITGFKQEANIVGFSTIDKSFEGEVYRILFADGSKILVGYKEESGKTFSVSNDASGKAVVINSTAVIHIWVLSPSQDVSAVGDPQQSIVDLGTQSTWNGSLYAANFLSTWFSANNRIQPPEAEAISGAQVIHGYGGKDDLVGALGNDTIFLDKAGLTYMAGGRTGPNAATDNMPSGNDTFVLMPNVVIPGDGQRTTTISGTDKDFFTAPLSGEVNTIEARGNNDLSFADIHWINKVVYNGAALLQFGGGNFFSNNHIASNTTVVGGASANTFKVWANPANISAGHSDSHGAPDIDLSHLVFQNWSAADHVTIIADRTGTAGSAVIKAPNVATTIIGGAQNLNQFFGGSANDTITGGTRDDNLRGNGGNDILNGGAGKDTLNGGTGNDTLQVFSSQGMTDTFVGNIGTDTLKFLGTTGVTLSGFAKNAAIEVLSGNGAVLLGTSAANIFDFSVLLAKSAVPFVDARAGDDRLFGSKFVDDLRGGIGNDTMTAGAGNDVLAGGTGNDTLIGDDGRDTLDGGTGKDLRTGGLGNDYFAFKTLNDSVVGVNRDQVKDFSHAQGDRIDLIAIDASTHAAGNQAFTFIGSQAFGHRDGELRYSGHILQGDVNGDAKTDFEIYVSAASLVKGDFLL